MLKAIDQLESSGILEKLDIAPIDIFGLKASMNEIHELNEQLFSTIFTIINDSDVYDDDIHPSIMYLLFETKRHFGRIYMRLSIS